MKRIISILFLVAIFATVSAQNTPVKFLRPTPKDLFATGDKAVKPSVWLLRPTAGVLATRITYDKSTKLWDTAPLSAVGLGVGYQHFVELPDGTPYNNIGVNLLLLTSVKIADVQQVSMGVGLFGTFFGFVNLGVDYQFGFKNIGLDTGVTLKF